MIHTVGYREKGAKSYKCVHSLIGCIVTEDQPEKRVKDTLYPFTLTFANGKTKKYYALSKEHAKKWLHALIKNTNSANLTDYYNVKVR